MNKLIKTFDDVAEYRQWKSANTAIKYFYLILWPAKRIYVFKKEA